MFLLDGITYCYENITPFQAAMLLSVLVVYLVNLLVRDMGVPPGPKGVPLFGYWPFLKTDTCHLHLTELTKQYGDVFSFRATGNLLIHLGSIKAVREAHVTKSDCFENRFTGYSILRSSFGDSLAFAEGDEWKVLRKFFLLKYKEYGMNAIKENAASSVYDAMKEVVEELRNMKGRPMHMTDMITMKCMLILRRIMFNDQGLTKENLQELISLYSEMSKTMNSTNLLLIGPFAKYFILPLMPSFWKFKNYAKRMHKIFFDLIDQHKLEYKESQVADLIDSYIKERDDRRKKGDTTAQYFTDKELATSLSQFFTDGTFTISALMESYLLVLVERPEEQGKIYQEIAETIGFNRLPTLEDKTKLPYTNAFINEVSRFTDFFPMFTSMQCSKDTTVQGYKIPVGAITLINFYAAQRNPNDFENPNEFNPSRYLPSPDKKRPDLPILFGLGKRSCIGEAFSMIQIFLFVTTLVQNFRLTFPEDHKTSSALFWSKDKLRLCAHPRSHKSS